MWRKLSFLLVCFHSFFLTSQIIAKPTKNQAVYHLSICMIFRDEAPYLKEWIEFHRLMGADHFYLCSHNSQDQYREVLQPYIDNGLVELKEVKNLNRYETQQDFNKLQLKFYNKCLKETKELSEWVAFIDSDEFLFPTKALNLVEFLKDYVDCDGIGVNWQMFGTAGVAKLRSDQLMIEQLISCAPSDLEEVNLPIKSIVQPKRVVGFSSTPHSPDFYSQHYLVNTDKIPFIGFFSPYIQVDQLRINHYWTRDEQFFWNQKIPRQAKWQGWTAEDIAHIPDKYNQHKDLTIQRFVPALRKQMKLYPF